MSDTRMVATRTMNATMRRKIKISKCEKEGVRGRIFIGERKEKSTRNGKHSQRMEESKKGRSLIRQPTWKNPPLHCFRAKSRVLFSHILGGAISKLIMSTYIKM